MDREELEKLTQDFQNNGGKIKKVAPDKTSSVVQMKGTVLSIEENRATGCDPFDTVEVRLENGRTVKHKIYLLNHGLKEGGSCVVSGNSVSRNSSKDMKKRGIGAIYSIKLG